MPVSVKKFRLKKYMSNGEIADKLGVVHGYNKGPHGVFSTTDGQWVGSRADDEVFTIHISRTDLHKKALQFADEIGES